MKTCECKECKTAHFQSALTYQYNYAFIIILLLSSKHITIPCGKLAPKLEREDLLFFCLLLDYGCQLLAFCSRLWWPESKVLIFNNKRILRFDLLHLVKQDCLQRYFMHSDWSKTYGLLCWLTEKHHEFSIFLICAQKWLPFSMWSNIIKKISVLHFFWLVCFCVQKALFFAVVLFDCSCRKLYRVAHSITAHGPEFVEVRRK